MHDCFRGGLPEVLEVSCTSMLLATGWKVIAEATRRDRNWGIGINMGDPRCENPSEWRGANLLGWALMEVRFALSRQGAGMQVPEPERIPGTASCGSASSQTIPSSHPSSTLNQHKKKFRKHCKVVREIWKLEDQKSRGESLEAPQGAEIAKEDCRIERCTRRA